MSVAGCFARYERSTYFFFEDFFEDFFAAFFFAGIGITSSWPLIADSETHRHTECQRSIRSGVLPDVPTDPEDEALADLRRSDVGGGGPPQLIEEDPLDDERRLASVTVREVAADLVDLRRRELAVEVGVKTVKAVVAVHRARHQALFRPI